VGKFSSVSMKDNNEAPLPFGADLLIDNLRINVGTGKRILSQGELEIINKRESEQAIRLGLWVLGIGFGGFLIWASVAPLDEGVPSLGVVSIETKRRVIQHLQGGQVKELFVREGQFVKESEVLVRLEDAAVRANLESARQTLAAHFENVIAQEAILRGLHAARESRQSQLSLLRKELDGVRELVKEGFVPVVQQLQLERNESELLSLITEIETNISRTRQALLELNHQIRASEERLRASRQDLERLEIKSPTNGQVVGLVITSAGTVIQPAQRIMDIIPENESLIIEAQIPPHFIDRIKPQDMVDVRFSNFVGDPQLVVEGILITISQDALIDQNTQQTYYLAQVKVTDSGLEKLGNRSMQPGMPAEVIIKTGSRTMLNYLISPLTRRIASSLKEN
jgi:protease secretion system membrane fusion protein